MDPHSTIDVTATELPSEGFFDRKIRGLPVGSWLLIFAMLAGIVICYTIMMAPLVPSRMGRPFVAGFSRKKFTDQMPDFLRPKLENATPAMRTALAVSVLRELIDRSRTKGRGQIIATDEGTLDSTFDDPKIWCWPVDAAGNPLPAKAFPLTSAGANKHYEDDADEIEIECEPQGEPIGFTFNYQIFGRSGRFSSGYTPVQEQRVDLLLPLVTWMYLTPNQMPPDYETVMRDLRLRPIDGRVAGLLKQTGPIQIYKHPTLPVLEAQFDGPKGLESLRISADPFQNWGVLDGRIFDPSQHPNALHDSDLQPPSTEFKLWFTIEEDALGPEVPASVIDDTKAADLFSEEFQQEQLDRIRRLFPNMPMPPPATIPAPTGAKQP